MFGQQPAQVATTESPTGFAVVVNHATPGKGFVDLRVQIIAISQHDESKVAPELPVHLASEHHHRIALARPLSMPEDTQLALPFFAFSHCINGEVDAEELVVAGEDLLRLARGLIEEDEVLHKIHQVPLVANPLEQRLHSHHARLLFGQTLPFMEVLPLGGHRADLSLFTVAQHHDSVVVEKVWDRVLVVGEVFLKSRFEILVDIFAFNEQKRQAVDKSHDVRPPAIEIASHPQLAYTEKVVVDRLGEVEHPQPLSYPLALVVAKGNLYTVTDQVVLFAIGSRDGLRGNRSSDLPHSVVIGLIG